MVRTGTAQKIPRSAGTYIVSFCGFAPVENPQVLVYVVIDEIQRDSQTNTGLAVEIAKKVLEGSLKELNVAKSSKKVISSFYFSLIFILRQGSWR